MKKYSAFHLYVVEKDGHKFICEKIFENEYREVLTRTKIIAKPDNEVESLTEYYPLWMRMCCAESRTIKEQFMLTKKDVLLKYAEINKNKIINDYLKEEQEELEYLNDLSKVCPKLTRQEALKNLQRIGILDENGELIGPYKEIFVKEEKQKILSNQKIDN